MIPNSENMLIQIATWDVMPAGKGCNIDRACFKEHALKEAIMREQGVVWVAQNNDIFPAAWKFIEWRVRLESTRMCHLRGMDIYSHVVRHVDPRDDAGNVIKIHGAARA